MKKMIRAALATMVATVGATSATAGTLFFSQDSGQLYTLNTTNGAATLVGSIGTTSSTVGLSNGPNGTLYASRPFGLSNVNVDGTVNSTVGDAGIEGLAYDGASNTLYGSINGSFGIIDQASGDFSSFLAGPGGDVEGLEFALGSVYGLADNGAFRVYNFASNSWTTIGNVGFASDNSGLAYDTEAGSFYAVSRANSNLYSINPLTGSSTLIGATGLASRGGGLAFIGTVGAVPEPATWAMMLIGFGAVGFAMRRKKVTTRVTYATA